MDNDKVWQFFGDTVYILFVTKQRKNFAVFSCASPVPNVYYAQIAFIQVA